MGLYNKLTTQGSNLTAYNGATPTVNPLATQASKMHYEYSINGNNFNTVNPQYQQYLDGVFNPLPQPSQLDINGVDPKGPLNDPSYGVINDSFSKGKYLDNLPK